jgi:deoxyribodipyrimidine photolyase-related protein
MIKYVHSLLTANNMTHLRFIFGDQLDHNLATLKDINKKTDVVFMCEVMEELTYVKHHKQKIVFVLSAMRHFAEELRKKGIQVHYVKFDDVHNSGTFEGELSRFITEMKPDQITLTEPSEYRVKEKISSWSATLPITLNLLSDTRFLITPKEFSEWVADKKQLRMEYFYRYMRKKHNILLDMQGEPLGGKWNFDKENRQSIPENIKIPKRHHNKIDAITQELIDTVNLKFSDHFGTLDHYDWAVTRKQALACLDYFIEHLLPGFGDYQDAMSIQQAFLFHSTLSPYLNFGLLNPREVILKAEAAHLENQVELNAVEGFIRQILGWREYVRGIYWLRMPKYATENYLNATRDLPWFYWSGETQMNCMREVIQQSKDHAYSHHIQRLMITGNFALLTGIDPKQVCEWYLIAYADALDWVELPNTLGMAIFGDGGLLASKPYAASGKYIDRMSNFCEKCVFNPNVQIGEKACPFNALYWDFLARNHAKLSQNQRLVYPYATWRKMAEEKRVALLQQAKSFLDAL